MFPFVHQKVGVDSDEMRVSARVTSSILKFVLSCFDMQKECGLFVVFVPYDEFAFDGAGCHELSEQHRPRNIWFTTHEETVFQFCCHLENWYPHRDFDGAVLVNQ